MYKDCAVWCFQMRAAWCMNAPTMATTFTLNPKIDAMALAAEFAACRRVRITDFLSGEGPRQLHEALTKRSDWRHVINSADRVVELDRVTRKTLTPEQARQLDETVYAGARSGFQYRYETIRTADDAASRVASDDPIAAFAHFLSQGQARDLLRQITAEPAIDFADAQATAYAPGDFLTGHDDRVEGKGRLAAYVFGLNPIWRIEWGGLLLVHRSDTSVEGVAPAFNTLDLFRVGQMHSVSEVTRSAAWRRYSVTGWLRKR